MFRPTAYVVAVLSDFVANGRQAVHHVSSALSTIPYGGFSPVRLQAGVRPRPSRAPATLIRALAARPTGRRSNASVCDSVRRPCGVSGPEALGSPAGHAVPPGHRLLWPHPRLWDPSRPLSLSVAGELSSPF
jgi:hypothetical protein